MDQQGCTIPQFGSNGGPNNVVVGDLDGDGESSDFAWLCSRADSTQLFAYTTYGGLETLTDREPDSAFWMGYFNLDLMMLDAEEAERYNERKRRDWEMAIPVATHGTLLLSGEKDGRYFYYLRGVQWVEWESIH